MYFSYTALSIPKSTFLVLASLIITQPPSCKWVTKTGSVSSMYCGRRNMHQAWLPLFLDVFCKVADEAQATVRYEQHMKVTLKSWAHNTEQSYGRTPAEQINARFAVRVKIRL